MTYGVVIDGTNTLTEWGLILLADLVVESPAPNLNLVTVPGVSGASDFTEVLGSVTYQMRNISFTLFKRVPDAQLKTLRDTLAENYHGKHVELVLPDDPTIHYEGRMSIGGVDGFNTGRIAVSMIADPVTYAEGTS